MERLHGKVKGIHADIEDQIKKTAKEEGVEPIYIKKLVKRLSLYTKSHAPSLYNTLIYAKGLEMNGGMDFVFIQFTF